MRLLLSQYCLFILFYTYYFITVDAFWYSCRFSHYLISSYIWPSVARCCWLGGRKGIRPVKIEWWGAGVVICLEQGADLHMAQQMPLPLTVSCFGKIQTGVTFLVPAHPGSPRQRAIKCVCVYGIIIALVFAEVKSSCSSRG